MKIAMLWKGDLATGVTYYGMRYTPFVADCAWGKVKPEVVPAGITFVQSESVQPGHYWIGQEDRTLADYSARQAAEDIELEDVEVDKILEGITV